MRNGMMKLSSFILLLAPGLLFGASSSDADWISPHPLEQEEAAPAALIPFPRHVEWLAGTCPKDAPVSVEKDASLSETLGEEGYELHVRADGVAIRASADAGVFYARKTLEQLGARGRFPCCRITDAPAFAVRGFMHDVGRNFRSVETLKADIDAMAQLKLNVFHRHFR